MWLKQTPEPRQRNKQQAATVIHSPKITAKAPENRVYPKRKRSYSNHSFSSAIFSFREGTVDVLFMLFCNQ